MREDLGKRTTCKSHSYKNFKNRIFSEFIRQLIRQKMAEIDLRKKFNAWSLVSL
jgi:predicted CopG family antitoxin